MRSATWCVGVLALAASLTACTSSVPLEASPTAAHVGGDDRGPDLDETSVPTFPGADSTGVPEGTALEPSGALEVTAPGTVIEGLDVDGSITIAANDVTVRDSLVRTRSANYAIRLAPGVVGVVIEDVEVDNDGGTGIGIFFDGGSGTARRVDVHSGSDGIRIQADGVIVEDSYVHDLVRVDGGHHDVVQIRRGDDIALRRNTLQAYRVDTSDPMNAAIQIGSLLGDDRISDLVVEHNLMNGGNYIVSAGEDSVDSALYRGNRLGRDFRYGVVAHLGPASEWDDSNVWFDTGEPAR